MACRIRAMSNVGLPVPEESALADGTRQVKAKWAYLPFASH
jgi:hypothetical protein